ncbi:MAG: 5'-3' exonuclease H3TH domain-containing protein, partial [Spirochaetota bacterium]
MNKILIVDGHAFAFRAYYAFQAANLKNSLTGKPSGAVFGFFRMLFKILGDFQPTHLVIPFDPGTPLERNKMFKDYKANRKPMPEDLRPQIKQIISMCEEFGFPISKIAGHEADDIIGTLSKQYAKGKNKVIIFSGDKDMFQLLSNQSVSMLRGKKGVTEFLEITKDTVKDMLGVTYNQVIDYMGIVGDTADNIPGVKGIGEKGAANLLTEYKNLEEIYKNVDKIKSKATKQKLLDHKDMAFLSRDLATIKTDLSLDLTLDDMKIVDYLKPERLNILKQQGFNALYRDMSKLAGVQVAEEPDNSLDIKSAKADYVLVESLDELKKVVKEFSKASAFCIDTETTAKEPVKAELLGFSLCYKAKKAYYVPVAYEESLFSQKSLQIADVVPILQPLLSNSKSLKIGQNIKYDMIVLQKYGLEFKGPIFDTMLASYVIQPEGRRHNMDALAKDYLNYNTIKYSDLVGSGRKKRALYEIDPQEVKGYACEDADITFQLYKVLEKKLEKLPTKSIYEKIEIPLIPVLVASES